MMARKSDALVIGKDVVLSVGSVARSSWKRLFRSWILVPFSLVVMLYCVLAINRLISLGTVDFPASVACLLILFFFLLIASVTLGDKNMQRVLSILDVPTAFALRTMNLYFTPSFILLPLSNAISGAEIGILIGVFVIGYVVQIALTAYTSRGLQMLLARTGKAPIGDAELQLEGSSETLRGNSSSGGSLDRKDYIERRDDGTSSSSTTGTVAEPNHEDTDTIDTSAKPPAETPPRSHLSIMSMDNESMEDRSRSQRWAEDLVNHLDELIYLSFFVFIGIPVYYATGYTMPIFLTLNVLIFFAANAIPPKIKRVAHPVLVTALFTILVIWVIALTRSKTLQEGLNLYKTGTTYLQYLRGSHGLPLPGAGDILASLLDASIVALAMPMYQYRRELYHFFIAIFLPVVVLTIPSLFGYPPLCSALGVSATISLAMAPRSVTLALAQLSAANLGGDTSAISPIAVVSGISGPIFGPSILRFLRISKDDFVTTGVVLGANSSAIATAMLLEKDRRAAALSSLSMSLFGIIFVILTAIPPVVSYVQSLVGL